MPGGATERVEYSTDLYILRRVEPGRRNGRLLFEVNNRGNKRILTYLSDSPSTTAALNEPGPRWTRATDS